MERYLGCGICGPDLHLQTETGLPRGEVMETVLEDFGWCLCCFEVVDLLGPWIGRQSEAKEEAEEAEMYCLLAIVEITTRQANPDRSFVA